MKRINIKNKHINTIWRGDYDSNKQKENNSNIDMHISRSFCIYIRD